MNGRTDSMVPFGYLKGAPFSARVAYITTHWIIPATGLRLRFHFKQSTLFCHLRRAIINIQNAATAYSAMRRNNSERRTNGNGALENKEAEASNIQCGQCVLKRR